MRIPLLFIPLVALLSAALSPAAPVSVTDLKDVLPGTDYHDSVKSLVERWALVSDAELALAAADAGKPAGGYYPEAPLTKRQLAAVLAVAIESAVKIRSGADNRVEEAILAGHKDGKLNARTATEMRDYYRREAAALLRLRNPAWKNPAVESVSGLNSGSPEFQAMQTLLVKFGTGGALLQADGSFAGTSAISEKELTGLLSHIFNLSTAKSKTGKESMGTIPLDPAAATVSRGKAAQLLDWSLTSFGQAVAALADGIDKRISVGAKPLIKTGSSSPPASEPAGNPDELLKRMNAFRIEYKTGVPDLAPGSREIIAQIADLIKQLPGETVIEIGVHTDSNGRESRNERLTLNRAREVLDILCRNGIPVERLKVKGYGSSRPVASNDTEEGREKNRRTEFSIVQPE